MIWDPATQEDPAAELVSQITDQITASCGNECLVPYDNVEELARAVHHFLCEDAGLQSIDLDCLMGLVSRALTSLGERHVARRLVLMNNGLLRPSEWEAAGNQAVWTLDLRQMTVRDDDSLELVFFNTLMIVIESIADLWDATDGDGLLGLKHVCQAAESLLGEAARGRRVKDFANEVQAACQDKFEQIGSTRKWTYIPRILNLDFT